MPARHTQVLSRRMHKGVSALWSCPQPTISWSPACQTGPLMHFSPLFTPTHTTSSSCVPANYFPQGFTFTACHKSTVILIFQVRERRQEAAYTVILILIALSHPPLPGRGAGGRSHHPERPAEHRDTHSRKCNSEISTEGDCIETERRLVVARGWKVGAEVDDTPTSCPDLTVE